VSFKVTPGSRFEKQAKAISKIYPGFKHDLAEFVASLETQPIQGSHLEHGIYKVRLSITGKSTGKSFGARSVHAVFSVEKEVLLLSVYDKSFKKDLSKAEMKELIQMVAKARLGFKP
jgi:hypothetical protein